MSARIFVDTNILVYTRDSSEPEKQKAAMGWMQYLWTTRKGCLSAQVLKEYYVTVTGKLKPGLDKKTARNDVEALFAWQPVPTNKQSIEGAWKVQDRYGFSFWDALIVSAAHTADCKYLLSEDIQKDQKLGTLQVINPFHISPAELKF
jgi:predicted nucleic acid-binding protein